jgi:hypothetical protein
MKPEHMRRVAGWVGDVLLRGRDRDVVRREVEEFRRGFESYEYCYGGGEGQ